MPNFTQFENNDPLPKSADFRQFILCKIGENTDLLSSKQVFEKLKDPSLQFAGHISAAKILFASPETVQFFNENEYLFSLIKNEDAYAKAKSDHRNKTSKLKYSFLEYLKNDLGLSHLPNADKIINYSWQEAHSSGYQAVYDHACEIADLFLPPELKELLQVTQELVTDFGEEYGDVDLVKKGQTIINKFKTSSEL